VIDHGEISQSVNLFGCKNSTLQIRGKVNAVTLGMNEIINSSPVLTHDSDCS
jgi:hypothetical protein